MIILTLVELEEKLRDGLKLGSGSLYVDGSKWHVDRDITLVGESGESYDADIYGFNSSGDKFVVLDSTKVERRNLAYALTVLTMMTDLKVSALFIISDDEDEIGDFGRIGDQRLIIPIRKLVYSVPQLAGIQGSWEWGGSEQIINDNSSTHRRDKLTLMVDIMRLLDGEESRITNIVYRCNLNFKSGQKLVDEMIGKGYVRTETDKTTRTYTITSTGRKALKNLIKDLELVE